MSFGHWIIRSVLSLFGSAAIVALVMIVIWKYGYLFKNYEPPKDRLL